MAKIDELSFQPLIETYRPQLEEIIRDVYHTYHRERGSRTIEDFQGEHEGIKYRSRHPYKGGKQQPVIILHVTFPEGKSLDIVLKRDTDGMCEKQKTCPVLQKVFPRVYLEADQVAAIEFIDGLELDQLREIVKDPQILEQLFKDAFETFDEVCHSEWRFQDIRFTEGHNFIYDKSQKRFRAFDIHSINESNETYEEKFLTFMEDDLRCWEVTDEAIRLFMYFIRAYLVKYPGKKMAFNGKAKVTLKVGDPGYEEQWSSFSKRVGWFIANKLPITSEKKGGFILNKDIENAAIHDDVQAFRVAYTSNSEHVYNLEAELKL